MRSATTRSGYAATHRSSPCSSVAAFPTLDRLASWLGGRVETRAVPIPFDCVDGFIEAFYGRPERLLDPAVRAAQSSWGLLGPGVEARAVAALASDLASGAWDRADGALRSQPTLDGPLALVVSAPA
jgi:hypothetical protein